MTKEKTIHDAIFAVQQAAPAISKETDNPFFKSKYADLPAIWDVIRGLLGENKLYVSHLLDSTPEGEIISTRLVYVPTGEVVESKSRITLSKHTAQEYGSYITYMRRYALSALLGLVTDIDDDGNAASVVKEQPKEQPKPKPKEATPMQEMAAKIQQQLKEAESSEVLTYVWNGFKVQLEDIKKASPDKAYPALEALYKKRMTETSQAPF
jgi:hypothetical protein